MGPVDANWDMVIIIARRQLAIFGFWEEECFWQRRFSSIAHLVVIVWPCFVPLWAFVDNPLIIRLTFFASSSTFFGLTLDASMHKSH
jgi:hypothetical protein